MSDTRAALAALEILAAEYRTAADALDAAVEALQGVVETAEFHQERQEALEKARPFLSEETIKLLGAGATGKSRPQKTRWRPPVVQPVADEWGGGG